MPKQPRKRRTRCPGATPSRPKAPHGGPELSGKSEKRRAEAARPLPPVAAPTAAELAAADAQAAALRLAAARPTAARAPSAASQDREPSPTPSPVVVTVEGAPARRPVGRGSLAARAAHAEVPPASLSPFAQNLPASFWEDEPPSQNGRHARRGWLGLLALATALLVCVASRSLGGQPLALQTWRSLAPLGHMVARSLFLEGEAVAAASLPDTPLAEQENLRREGHGSIRGGVVFVPETFSTTDGAYDLLLHFHGNTAVVKESAEVAGLNAIVAVVNLGVGSAPYEEAYAVPGTYEALLDQIQRVIGQRGVSTPHLRRVALASWSAGYGAISTVLNVRRGADPLDSILVLDGIHCGWLDDRPTELNPLQLGPFVRAAKLAAEGDLLFSITHSEIEPPTYASASQTANYLLASVGYRAPLWPDELLAPPHVVLRAAEGAVAKKLEKRMEPISEARVGGLHVRGYRGNTPEHHMAHLLQMAATVIPELAERWKALPESVPSPRTAP